MKRILAFALALVLILGLALTAGADFSDAAAIAENHAAAVEYMNEKGIISGFPDGSFRPKGELTRAQAAKILCVALEGTEQAEKLTKTESGFTDVPAADWAAKYIAYCADKEIVAGVGNGKFNPNGQLSAAAFAKMLLVAYGYADAKDLVGTSWVSSTQNAMRKYNLQFGTDFISNDPTTRENACKIAYNIIAYHEIMQVEPEAYKETTLSFDKGGSYRLLGRAMQTGDGVICDYSADGVEFKVDCKGEISVTVSTDKSTNNTLVFRVIVDGVPSQRALFPVGQNTRLCLINVKPGEHTIRIVKDTQVVSAKDLIKSVTLLCKPETVQSTQPKTKLLEVIGDSITAGFGILPTENMSSTVNTASAIQTYGYRVAETLGMDYRLVCKGGIGFLARESTPALNMTELYEKQNGYRDPDTAYDFSRKADLIILALGTNDSKTTDAENEESTRNFIEMLRKHHGKDVPIVLMYNMMGQSFGALYEKLASEIPNCYALKTTTNRLGAMNHPDLAGQDQFTKEVLEFLKTNSLA